MPQNIAVMVSQGEFPKGRLVGTPVKAIISIYLVPKAQGDVASRTLPSAQSTISSMGRDAR